jgi:hypothetical protein
MGFFIGNGLSHIKSNDRYVNVRGLAEKAVTADTAQRVIHIQHAGPEPKAIFPFIEDSQKQIMVFLLQAGIKETEIEAGQWTTQRTSSEDLKNDPSLPHFTVTGSIERYKIVPTDSYEKQVVDKFNKENPAGGIPYDTICGAHGQWAEGEAYFEYHPAEAADKFLYVVTGEDEPLFDENSIIIGK